MIKYLCFILQICLSYRKIKKKRGFFEKKKRKNIKFLQQLQTVQTFFQFILERK